MGDVLTFTQRPKPAAIVLPAPLAGPELRASLEEAAQIALDGDPDFEDGADAEPSLAAPENTAGSQVVYICGNDQDREAEAPEIILPEVAAEPRPEATILPWRGRGNVIAAAGVAILDLLERA